MNNKAQEKFDLEAVKVAKRMAKAAGEVAPIVMAKACLILLRTTELSSGVNAPKQDNENA